MEKEKKKVNGWMISTIILAVLYAVLLTVSLHYIIENKKAQISYNGVEYESDYAYVKLVIENNSEKQIVFDSPNFSIPSTDITKTSSALYYEKNISYIQLTGSYILNNGDKVKIKLQFNKTDITSETIIYFNGERISNL